MTTQVNSNNAQPSTVAYVLAAPFQMVGSVANTTIRTAGTFAGATLNAVATVVAAPVNLVASVISSVVKPMAYVGSVAVAAGLGVYIAQDPAKRFAEVQAAAPVALAAVQKSLEETYTAALTVVAEKLQEPGFLAAKVAPTVGGVAQGLFNVAAKNIAHVGNVIAENATQAFNAIDLSGVKSVCVKGLEGATSFCLAVLKNTHIVLHV